MPKSGLVGQVLGPRSVFTPHAARTGILATRMRWPGARLTWEAPTQVAEEHHPPAVRPLSLGGLEYATAKCRFNTPADTD